MIMGFDDESACDEQDMDHKRRPWTKEEDDILRKRIKTYGLKNWSVVADGLPGRSGKSCSERWRIYLTPGVKRPTLEPFSDWETAVIYLGQQVHGNQWCSIARLLPGRTNTAIKNYWKTALTTSERKRVANNKYIQQGYSIEDLLANPPSAQQLAASAARRRKAAAAATAVAKRAAAAEADQPAAVQAEQDTAEQDAAEQVAELQEQRATSSSSAAAAAAAMSSGSMEDGNSGSDFDADAEVDADAHLTAAWGDYDPELCADLGDDWDLSDATDPLTIDEGSYQHEESNMGMAMHRAGGVDAAAACAAGDGASSGGSNAATPDQPLQQGMTPATVTIQPIAAPVGTSMAAASSAAMSNSGTVTLELPQQQTAVVGTPGYYAAASLYQPVMQAQEMMIPVAAAGMTAVDMANQQQLWQQQQQQMWQQQNWQQQQLYGWAPVCAGNASMLNTAGSPGKAASRGHARGSKKRVTRDSDSDSDDEETRAAAAAAAAAIASGAIQLNPNVHPAAAAAAAADAARAAARAAARKAAAAAAASNRKKSKLQGSSAAPAAAGGSGSSSSCDAPAGMDADMSTGPGIGSDTDECHADEQQGRQRRKAATAGLAKVMAAVHDDGANPMQFETDPDAGQKGSSRGGCKSPGKGARHGGKAAAAKAAANGGSAYTISGPEESVVHVQRQQPPAPAPVSAPAPASAAAPAPAPPSLSIDDHLDDPIMMELYKHELSIAQAMGSTTTGTAAPTSSTAGRASASVTAVSGPSSPRLVPTATVTAVVEPSTQQKPALTALVPDSAAPATAAPAAAACGTPCAAATVQTPAAAVGSGPAVQAGFGITTSSSNSENAAAAGAGAPAGVTAAAAGSDATPGTAGVAKDSVAVAAGANSTSAVAAAPSSAPVLRRQTSGPMAAPANSACDSEGSVFTASSRTSISITSSTSAPAAVQPAAAGVLSGGAGQPLGAMMRSVGLKGTGLPAPAFDKGYFVMFTGANGQRQQVLVQPAMSGGSGISSSSSDGGSCSSSSSMDTMGLAHMRSPGMIHGGAAAGMTSPAGSGVMSNVMHHMSMGMPRSGQGYNHQAHGIAVHHNPVVAAMLSQSNLLQTSGSCPVLHATMAALSNQGACTCVYCVTSSSRKCMAPPAATAGTKAGVIPAQLASMAMPPPRPVVMPGKPAAAAAAAAAAASAATPGALPGMMPPMEAALSNHTTSSGMSGYDMGMLRSSSSSQHIPGMAAMYAATAAAPGMAADAPPVATTNTPAAHPTTNWQCEYEPGVGGLAQPQALAN